MLRSALLLLLAACSDPVSNIRPQQAATISPQAQRFLRGATLVQAPVFPQVALDEIREKVPDPTVKHDVINGVPVVVVEPPEPRHSAIGLYTHGGAFVAGAAHDVLIMRYARDLGITIFCVDYALAPEAKFPVAINETLAVYRALVDKPIVAFGSSAGGNLMLATILKARDEGLKLPIAVVAVTPWTDLTGAGDSYVANEGRDVIAWKHHLSLNAVQYAGANVDRRNPLLSPVYADFSKGFAPTVITTGTRDLFLSDSVRLHRALQRAGVPSELLIFEGMWHAFNAIPGVPESEECNAEVVRFVREQLHGR